MPKPPRSDSFKEVNERPCIRCQHPLTLEGGHLVFCGYCGAPQIFLSEELQEQTALEVQRYSERAAAAQEPAPDGPATEGLPAAQRRSLRRERRARQGRWPLAVEYALLSSGIALGLDLAGLVFAPLLTLAWLWIFSAPTLTVGFYNTRVRSSRLSAGFAARLGLLTGLLVSVSCGVVFTLGLLLSRYVLKNGTVDAGIADAIAQIRANAQMQYGAAAQPVLHLLGIPEFRVGFLLWMGTVAGGAYLVLSTATAGLAGLLLRRRRTA